MLTTNLGLKKPELTDNADLMVFIGENMDTINTLISGKANTSHGNHVPSTEAANNARFLRNDNTWQTVTPANIGAAPTTHYHDMGYINTGNLATNRLSEPSYVTGSITATAKPLFDVLRGDRTAFLPASQIIIESSTDAGVTWVDAGVSDLNKQKLFTGQRPNISIPLKNGVKNTDCMIRITITGMKYNVPTGTVETAKYNYWNSTYITATERYFSAQNGWSWVSANSDRIYMKVERATGAAPNTWYLDNESFQIGWSGGNYFTLSGNTFGGGTTQTGNFWNWRFTFRTATSSNDFDNAKLATTYTNSAQSIHHIKISGMNVWSYSNNYMYNDHMYTWDENQNVTFPSNVIATQLLEGANRVYSANNNNIGTGATNYAAGNHVHSYTDLTNKPTIPTKTSQLTNDSGFLSSLPTGTTSQKGIVQMTSAYNLPDNTVAATAGAVKSVYDIVLGRVPYTTTLANGANLNTITTSGFYVLGQDFLNGPNTTATQLIVSRGGDTMMQIIGDYYGYEFWIRVSYGMGGTPTHGPWQKIALQGNSLDLDGNDLTNVLYGQFGEIDISNVINYKGSTMPKMTVTAVAPSNPSTGDLWIW